MVPKKSGKQGVERGLNMTIEERLRKFLFRGGSPVGVEFSDKEVREYIRLFLGEARNERARRMLTEDLIFLILEHLSEKED